MLTNKASIAPDTDDIDQPPGTMPAAVQLHSVTPISLADRLRDLETDLITWALKAAGGNKSRAAELLKIKRSTLGDRIKHCGLEGVGPAVRRASASPAAEASRKL